MKDKKNIDRLFQERFKDFEVFPKEKVWKNIKRELQSRKKRRVIVLPFWSKIAGVAAVIAILMLIGNGLFFNSNTTSVATSPEKNEVKKADENQKKPFENTKTSTQKSVANAESNSSAGKNKMNANTEGKSIQQKTKSSSTNENPPSNAKDALSVGNINNAKTGVKNSDESKENQGKQLTQHKVITQEGLAKNTVKSNKAVKGFDKNPPENHQTQGSENDNSTRSALVKNTAKPSNPEQKSIQQKNKNKTGKLNSKAKNTGIAKTENISKRRGFQKVDTDNSTEESLAKNQKNVKDDSLNTVHKNKKRSLLDAIAKNPDQTDKTIKEENGKGTKFALRPNISPIYYNSLSGGSAIDPKFSNNKAEGEVTMSYGIDVSYAISKRVKIRSGISKVNMSYNTKNIAFTSSPQAKSLNGFRKNAQTEHLAVHSRLSNELNRSTLSEVEGSAIDPYTSGQLNQQFGFIEVPLEIEYALLDKRFDINVIGGASTLFLDDNSIHINSYQGTTDLGKASNLNSVSFTTNFGLGFGYDITKELNFNLEPTFKYQFHGFSGDTSGFKPYYFGVYTGISFKF